MSHFDEAAATWDEDPRRIKRAQEISRRIRELIDLKPVKNALEYGSGTGHLSFELKDDIPEITLMDESERMTAVTVEKCRRYGASNLHPIRYDLIANPLPEERYDLIFTQLTLHHIEELDLIFEVFNEILKPGGKIALIDLEKEDGSFHDYEFHGHRGFERDELEDILNRHGFQTMHYEVCYNIEKEMEDGSIREYPLFLWIAAKK